MESHFLSEDHGGLNPAELKRFGVTAQSITDFSVNSNPFGPAPAVLEALRQVDISTYPDRFCAELRDKLARANAVPLEHILPGNGTAELILLITQAFIKPGDQAIILGPTFGEYQRAVQIAGGIVEEIRATPPTFDPPIGLLIERIQQEQPRLVFVCNPNNPTGLALPKESIQHLATACGEKTILVLDEAYRAFMSGEFFESPIPSENCLTLRSMTKEFALAGLRLGYILGAPQKIAQISRLQPAWSVNAFAQAAGLAIFQALDDYHANLQQLTLLKRRFFSQITALDFAVSATQVHFGIINVRQSAREVRQKLLAHSIQVRDCASFGLPEYIRVSTRKEADNALFLSAIRNVCR